jgi:hypothetical protein
MHHGKGLQAQQEVLGITGDIDLEIGNRFRRLFFDDFDTQDVALRMCDHAGQLVQNARAGIGAHFYSDSLRHS